jgi:branched-chain amino acid transport system permease protein
MAAAAEPVIMATDAAPPGLFGLSRAQLVAFVVMLAAIGVAPFVLYPIYLMKVMCFALFACAFNLLLGYVGLLSFGHAAYFGMGGYIGAHVAKVWGLPPELAILAAGLVAAALGAAFGWLAIRRAGIYFAMITLALAQLVFFFANQAPFTGGEDGIQQVPRGRLLWIFPLSDDLAMYGVVAVVFLVGFLAVFRIVHSPFGQVLKAIRDNEPRAVSLGYRVEHYKLLAFTLSAFLSGVAGGTKALVFGIATLTDVHWSMSGEVVLMTLVGGMGTMYGPVIGALVIVTMQNYLAQFGAWVTIIQGVIFVATVLAFRRGIIGEIANWIKKPL